MIYHRHRLRCSNVEPDEPLENATLEDQIRHRAYEICIGAEARMDRELQTGCKPTESSALNEVEIRDRLIASLFSLYGRKPSMANCSLCGAKTLVNGIPVSVNNDKSLEVPRRIRGGVQSEEQPKKPEPKAVRPSNPS